MIVVTGATGNVGRPLLELLTQAGEKVTALSRRPSETPGVTHVAAGLDEPDRLRTAFTGAEAVFVIVPHERNGAPADILAAARDTGVARIVLLTSQLTQTRPWSPIHVPMVAFEDELRASDLKWTILRPGGFASNTLEWAESVRSGRIVRAPFADVGLPVIDPLDIAEVAAAALLDDTHIGRTHLLTGPRVITPRQQAAVLSDLLGEPVRFVEQSRQEVERQMLTYFPQPAVEAVLGVLGTPTEVEQRVSPDVARVLGREPRPYADWAKRHLAAFT